MERSLLIIGKKSKPRINNIKSDTIPVTARFIKDFSSSPPNRINAINPAIKIRDIHMNHLKQLALSYVFI